MNEHDTVIITKEFFGIPANTKGTIVHTYPLSPSFVEVEFFDEDGNTLSVETVNVLDLKKR